MHLFISRYLFVQKAIEHQVGFSRIFLQNNFMLTNGNLNSLHKVF